jgi:D-glycero-D-manno-heptose 1,7-bisphosphate phosphatase
MGICKVIKYAVFLDRDGVINRDWWNFQTQAWESPIRPEDFSLHDGALEALLTLRSVGYRLFLVSNQPSAAKGKCTVKDLKAVHERFLEILSANQIEFDDFFYSYTHPSGVVRELSGPSPERKPSPYFLNYAISRFGLERGECWMVGDRCTDIECGKRAGVRTIRVNGSKSDSVTDNCHPDFMVPDLPAAVAMIIATGLPGPIEMPRNIRPSRA